MKSIFELNAANNNIIKFIISKFKKKDYDAIKNFLNEATNGDESSKDQLLSLKNYAALKWAAENNDIGALNFLKENLSENKMIEALSDNENEALQLFLTYNTINNTGKEELLKGLNIFLEGYKKNIRLITDDEEIMEYLINPSILEAFQETLSDLKISSKINEFDYQHAMDVLGNTLE